MSSSADNTEGGSFVEVDGAPGIGDMARPDQAGDEAGERTGPPVLTPLANIGNGLDWRDVPLDTVPKL